MRLVRTPSSVLPRTTCDKRSDSFDMLDLGADDVTELPGQSKHPQCDKSYTVTLPIHRTQFIVLVDTQFEA